MLAVGIVGRLGGASVIAVTVSALLVSPLPSSGQVVQAPKSSFSASSLTRLEDSGGSGKVTVDELKQHAEQIGDMLAGASAKVERLSGNAEGNPEAEALVGAIRHELILSRQWNGHLTSILLEVAEARQALEVREQKAASEIIELTSVAEEARLELIALWKALQPKEETSLERPRSLPDVRPDDVMEDLKGQGAAIEDVRKALDQMDDMQKDAVGDIEAVRTKIIDALHTLAPHRETPFTVEQPKAGQVEGSLTSQEITAWAASISSKLHHEGFDDYETARKVAEARRLQSMDVEAMVMRGEVLATTAVRIAPDQKAAAIATVVAGSPLLVTGKVVDLDWYRVELGDDRYGFVSIDLIKRQASSVAPLRS